MRTAQSPSIDFNQMLVVSVFFHFFLFTVVMFLPQTQDTVKRIIPTFTVNFVDIPTGADIEPAPPAPPVEKQPVAPLPPKTPVAKKPVPPKPKPIPKKAESLPIPPKPKPIPEKSAASKALVSKLDELARLQKKKTIPKKDKPAVVPLKPKENVLKDFESMKMKTAAEKKPTRKKIAKDDLALKELEFEHLSKQSASAQSQDKSKKTSSLLKELDELEQMNKQAHAALNKPEIRKADPKAAELVKQLESIKNKKESVQIKIDRSKLSSRHSQKFKSGIRNLKIAEIQKRVAAPTAASGVQGDPGADALSKYVGEVYVKIMKNWKDPLGGGNGQVQVSFSIFPMGNIAMPKILKSSGDPKLDILAVRAIKNAVPLPPFPKEIKEPNLPLILKFDYVPSKN
jgi:TolA protein